MLISPVPESVRQDMVVKRVTILGSTGSIGVSTLDVIRHTPERFQVVSLVAGRNTIRLIEQARLFNPEVVAIEQESQVATIKEALAGTGIKVLSGMAGILEAASWPTADMVVSAIVGAAGLEPTLAAIRAGKDIALANKECLVMAGSLFMEEVEKRGVRLIPVDSEHSAIFQVLHNGNPAAGYLNPAKTQESSQAASGTRVVVKANAIHRLTLTASGGPFRGWKRAQLQEVTPAMALAHPSWQMGRKISIDSASMMNKGLEVIEAFHLFSVASTQIKVVVHPQSIVHSLISYRDGSVLAQMGVPDMRTPIAVALAWPERLATTVDELDLAGAGQLDFFPAPSKEDFPCLDLAYRALQLGGGMAAILNAANEVAVAAFLEGKMGFLDIPKMIEWVMEKSEVGGEKDVVSSSPVAHGGQIGSIEDILQTDRQARRKAAEWLARHGKE